MYSCSNFQFNTLVVASNNRSDISYFQQQAATFFIYRRKGLLFAIGGFAFHQLYYLYSSLAFVYSWIEVKA